MWRAIEARAQSRSQDGAAYLPRILAELDAHPLTVLGRGIQHQFFDVARVAPPHTRSRNQ
jgi:hypothetical protein